MLPAIKLQDGILTLVIAAQCDKLVVTSSKSLDDGAESAIDGIPSVHI